MVDFLRETDAATRAKSLSDMIRDEAAWRAASTFIYAAVTEAFYDVARERNYDADNCREFLALNMLYHICNLAVESGIQQEEFMTICREGYNCSMEIADESFETAGNA